MMFMNEEHPTSESRQSLSQRELEIVKRLRENPELAEQFYALLEEIGGSGSDYERSLDEMEGNVVGKTRDIARQVLEQAAQAQERRLNEKTRAGNLRARRDRKKTPVAQHRRRNRDPRRSSSYGRREYQSAF
jgi:hypothetical protein